MDEDYGILEETAFEEMSATYEDDLDAETDDLDFEDEESFYDDFALDVEYGFEDYEPSPYDGTASDF